MILYFCERVFDNGVLPMFEDQVHVDYFISHLLNCRVFKAMFWCVLALYVFI